jgi:hypothetical protein
MRYDIKLSKSSIMSKLYTYIRDCQLRNKYNNSVIHLDVGLKNLFNLPLSNTIDSYKLMDEVDKLYKKEKNNQLEEIEKDLLIKLEKVREQKRIDQINIQRNYVIYEFIKNSNNYFTDEEAINLIFYICEKEYHPITHYLRIEDRNLLVSLQLLNRYAVEHQIRNEESYEVISDFLFRIKAIYEYNLPKFI